LANVVQGPPHLREFLKDHFKKLEHREFVPGKTRIPLTVPTYGPDEVGEALDSLLSTWVTMGKKVKLFEELFAEYVGSKHAVMVNSGSSANFLALSVLTNPTFKGRIEAGSELITPAVTWATTVYPIMDVGCVPVLVDVDLSTFNITAEGIEAARSPKTKAIVPVHLLGNPCPIDQIARSAQQHGLAVVEDACEATGAELDGRKVGSFGAMGTFSFFMSHHISTIEGGMVVTDNDDIHEHLKAMRAFGWVRELRKGNLATRNPQIDPRFLFVTHGYNFRPTEIQGAFGIHQIRKLDDFIARRRENAEYWNRRLAPYQDMIIIPEERLKAKHVYFGYPITLKPETRMNREEMVAQLERDGIETRPIMAGNIAEQPVMRHIPHRISGKLGNSRIIMRHSFFFGNHTGIGTEEREYIADRVVEFLDSSTKK
jgi:CDP-6-deoxy-D-xylo-4-hexulose-3-dehydrase